MDKPNEIARALRRLSVETGSLACLGCGHEHNCSTHGCAILRDAADLIVQLNDFDQTQSKIALERCQKVEAQLVAEKAKYAELQRYNVDCTKKCDALVVEKADLQSALAESQRREQAAVERIAELEADRREPVDVEMDGRTYRIIGPADASGPHIDGPNDTFRGCRALFWYKDHWHTVKNTGIKERLRILWDEHYGIIGPQEAGKVKQDAKD